MSEAAVPSSSAGPFTVDRALAGKLEAAHGWCIARYAGSLQRWRPRLGAAVLLAGGGIAIYAGPSPFSFAVGVGMSAPVSAGEIQAIEDFFSARDVPARIDVTPYSYPGLADLLSARDYRISELTTVLFIDLHQRAPAAPDRISPAAPGLAPLERVAPGFQPGDRSPEVSLGVEVRAARAGEVLNWVELIAQSFYVSEPGPHARANMAALFAVPDSLNTVATVGGEIAGVAGGMMAEGGGISTLFASAVAVPFRGRGLHRAMLDFRLRLLRQAGRGPVMVTATPGSTSERNLLRHGFTACYEKATYVKTL